MSTEEDIKRIFITPAIKQAGWDSQSQIRQEVHLTKGRIIVHGKIVLKGDSKFAD